MQVGDQATTDFLDGKDYSCAFSARSGWALSASVKVFTAAGSARDLLDTSLLKEKPYATVVDGVADAAGYAVRSTTVEFMAVRKAGAKAYVVLLLGQSGADDQARYTAIAKAVLANAPG